MNKFFKNFSIPYSHLSSRKGFTLIEILSVFTIIGILTALGYAAYISYANTQTVQQAATDVVAMLNRAKQQSLSQVIPSSCGKKQVTGYQVDITVNGQQYALSAICQTKQIIATNNLPTQVKFVNGSTSSVFYAIATGMIANSSTISLIGYGKSKIISISQTGNASIN